MRADPPPGVGGGGTFRYTERVRGPDQPLLCLKSITRQQMELALPPGGGADRG